MLDDESATKIRLRQLTRKIMNENDLDGFSDDTKTDFQNDLQEVLHIACAAQYKLDYILEKLKTAKRCWDAALPNDLIFHTLYQSPISFSWQYVLF